ncbi:MAG: M12 family metallopeptidase [Myxococcota bacterium]
MPSYRVIIGALALIGCGGLGCAEAGHRDAGPLGLAPDDDRIRDLDGDADLRNATIELPTVGSVDVLYRVVDGRGFWTGDVLLGDVEDIDSGFRAASVVSGLWPNKTVKYRWDAGISGGAKARLQGAMADWEAVTSVRFLEDNSAAGGYVKFRSDKSGCYSAVGYYGENKALELNLDNGCEKDWIARHELGHLLGLWHEHSRQDRDEHIDIDWDNIEAGAASEFDKYSKDSSGTDRGAYDFNSIMQYHSWSFAKDENKPVITKKNGDTFDQPSTISAGDIAAIQAMYAGNGGPGGDEGGDEGEDEPADDPEGGDDGGEAEPGSCSGNCGSADAITAADGSNCYCDTGCKEYGDCCKDKEDVCGAAPEEPKPDKPATCEGHCGKTTGVPDADGKECYCDEVCTGNGDCCSDYAAKCGGGGGDPEPDPAGSCAGQCGSDQSQLGCFCDMLCTENQDCCGDYVAQCG